MKDKKSLSLWFIEFVCIPCCFTHTFKQTLAMIYTIYTMSEDVWLTVSFHQFVSSSIFLCSLLFTFLSSFLLLIPSFFPFCPFLSFFFFLSMSFCLSFFLSFFLFSFLFHFFSFIISVLVTLFLSSFLFFLSFSFVFYTVISFSSSTDSCSRKK